VWPALLLFSFYSLLVHQEDHHWPFQFWAEGYPKCLQGWLPYFP
jgi:hypothetical protein